MGMYAKHKGYVHMNSQPQDNKNVPIKAWKNRTNEDNEQEHNRLEERGTM